MNKRFVIMFLFAILIVAEISGACPCKNRGKPGINAGSPINSTVGIENNSGYSYFLTNISASSATCQSRNCFTSLSPGGQQWVIITDTTGWIALSYNVYDKDNPAHYGYLGNFTVNLTPQSANISAVSGGTALLGPYSSGAPFTITFVPNGQKSSSV